MTDTQPTFAFLNHRFQDAKKPPENSPINRWIAWWHRLFPGRGAFDAVHEIQNGMYRIRYHNHHKIQMTHSLFTRTGGYENYLSSTNYYGPGSKETVIKRLLCSKHVNRRNNHELVQQTESVFIPAEQVTYTKSCDFTIGTTTFLHTQNGRYQSWVFDINHRLLEAQDGYEPTSTLPAQFLESHYTYNANGHPLFRSDRWTRITPDGAVVSTKVVPLQVRKTARIHLPLPENTREI